MQQWTPILYPNDKLQQYSPNNKPSNSGEDSVSGYDMLVNAVWPEIASCIELNVPSIFAPGNPDVFHEVPVW